MDTRMALVRADATNVDAHMAPVGSHLSIMGTHLAPVSADVSIMGPHMAPVSAHVSDMHPHLPLVSAHVPTMGAHVAQGGQVTPVQVKDQNRCGGYPARGQGYVAHAGLGPGWVTLTSVLIFDLYGTTSPPCAT